MLGQDGARIDTRALLFSPDRSVLRSKAVQSSPPTPLHLQCLAASVAAFCTPLEEETDLKGSRTKFCFSGDGDMFILAPLSPPPFF